MKLINNKEVTLLDSLQKNITSNSNLFISCNYFTGLAIFDLLDNFSVTSKVLFLINNQVPNDDLNFIQQGEEFQLNKELNRKFKISKVIELVKNKFYIRKGDISGQNIIIIQNEGKSICYNITPNHLTSQTLGSLPSFENFLIQEIEDENNQYLTLFKTSWENSKESIEHLIVQNLERAIRSYSGEEIYKYSIRNIFQYSTVNERADEKLKKVGFKDSKIWTLLYNFQKDAVIGAIEKIETFGGCIIADSVGLGKTFEALAVMKYYQLRNDRILVLTPKKLRENWTLYQLNDKRNVLAEDRLNYDVLNHTDLSRENGKSGDIDLDTINWGNYDLVVIDESHNFRNNPNKRDGVTRYARLMNDVIRSNIRTKVLMLSATPVNNRMNDLKNQIAFITEAKDNAFMAQGIDSIAQVMKDTQRRFTQWYRNSDPENLDVNDLMNKLDGAYFKILDMLTIARSRKHIEKYYDTSNIGEFPTRLTPITVSPPIDNKSQFKDISQLFDEISTLTLASYSPLGYVRSDRRDDYEEKYDMQTHTGSVFRQVDREQSLIYLMRVNLLKRLESSIYSFRITLDKLIKLVNSNLEQIENHRNSELDSDLNITEIDIDDTELEDLLVGGKTKVLLNDMDLIRWKQDLKLDKNVLENLMASVKLIDPNRDAKLEMLKMLIEQKIKTPINPENKKVIVFTAFSDTAGYLYQELKDWILNQFQLNSALVTGSGSNKTNMANTKSDLNSILTHFSPQSKKRSEIYPEEKNEIDILFCTDCISEGQNLQDCDYLVNYDIHWNPVRIIQRFGRIDRIGSTNKEIQLVNFFPNMELDSFIDLVARVKGKMVMLDVSATGEDNVISKNSREMQDLDYRKRQLKQLQNQVIDLEDVQGNISITDMTFNDFKIDLEKSTDEQLEHLDNIPPASYAVVSSNLDEVSDGVIFCIKDRTENFKEKLHKNILYPYFLVYKSLDGNTSVGLNNTKLALDYFRKLCMNNDKLQDNDIKQHQKETGGDKKVDKYKSLLNEVLQDVAGVQEEVGLSSLARPGGTMLTSNTTQSDESLELISYLIIK